MLYSHDDVVLASHSFVKVVNKVGNNAVSDGIVRKYVQPRCRGIEIYQGVRLHSCMTWLEQALYYPLLHGLWQHHKRDTPHTIPTQWFGNVLGRILGCVNLTFDDILTIITR